MINYKMNKADHNIYIKEKVKKEGGVKGIAKKLLKSKLKNGKRRH